MNGKSTLSDFRRDMPKYLKFSRKRIRAVLKYGLPLLFIVIFLIPEEISA